MKYSSIWVIVPAAGVGKRMQSTTPKQYLKLGERTVLDHTLMQLLSHENIAGVVLGIGAEDDYWPDSLWYGHAKVMPFIGGKERSDTVRLGLEYLMQSSHLSNEFVLVHDAARPFITHESINALLANTSSHGCLLAIPAKDTIKESAFDKGVPSVKRTIDRRLIWQAQTPQKFVIQALIQALKNAESSTSEITDESSAMELSGYQPELVEGDASNFKITLPIDLVIANALLSYDASC
ncbi:2-C-methyl-D-erythritol 4-phosphate cytidylyltransferase [Marinomonas algicola]|uniref:2-C-methyl-D-erythritol 4-phosphate cytidylyltransferase n=1 Tax=Marinomonas algicola TaxID=2773454 RepID=UPI00174C14CC|nr:2-C-methyl-D-erythritol 4-phosphate cytidylyltransferase [Marinomonas algicola]